MLYYSIILLYYITLYCIILYYMILYYIMLYYIILCVCVSMYICIMCQNRSHRIYISSPFFQEAPVQAMEQQLSSVGGARRGAFFWDRWFHDFQDGWDIKKLWDFMGMSWCLDIYSIKTRWNDGWHGWVQRPCFWGTFIMGYHGIIEDISWPTFHR